MATEMMEGQVGTVNLNGEVRPTPEHAEQLGQLFKSGQELVNNLTKNVRAYREYLGPRRQFASDEGKAAARESLNAAIENFIDKFEDVIGEIHALPPGTTPRGWTANYDARAAAISVLCGKIGTNLDAVVTSASAGKVLKAAYPG